MGTFSFGSDCKDAREEAVGIFGAGISPPNRLLPLSTLGQTVLSKAAVTCVALATYWWPLFSFCGRFSIKADVHLSLSVLRVTLFGNWLNTNSQPTNTPLNDSFCLLIFFVFKLAPCDMFWISSGPLCFLGNLFFF
jgi:hypothetical protein